MKDDQLPQKNPEKIWFGILKKFQFRMVFKGEMQHDCWFLLDCI